MKRFLTTKNSQTTVLHVHTVDVNLQNGQDAYSNAGFSDVIIVDDQGGSSNSSSGLIVGLVLGVIVALGMIVALIVIIVRFM